MLARAPARTALVVLAAVALGLVPQSAVAQNPDPDFYGVNSSHTLWTLGDDRIALHLEAMRAGGLSEVRYDAEWQRAEARAPHRPTNTHYFDWRAFDQIVTRLATRGLRWYPFLAYSTNWSAWIPHNRFSRPKVADYVTYATAFARRYGHGGTFWSEHPELPYLAVTSYEIWNEPNVAAYWQPIPEAYRYAELFMAVSPALHAVDPSARVVVGGLANSVDKNNNPVKYLASMYAARPELSDQVDAVGLHPYARTVDEVLASVRSVRAKLDELGETDVVIDVNEIGWSTKTSNKLALLEWQRAVAYRELVGRLSRSNCNIARLIPYAWVTAESNQLDHKQWFGIFNHDATAKQSGSAYLDAVAESKSELGGGGPDVC